MTADLSEGDSDSRPPSPSFSELRPKADGQLGASGDFDRLKGGHRKQVKDTDGNLERAGFWTGKVNKGKSLRATADLTTGFGDSWNGRPKAANHGHGLGGQGEKQDWKQRPSICRNLEVVSSEGDEDDQTEDDFGEVDGTVAEAESGPLPQQPKQGREQDQSSQRKETQQAVRAAQAPAAIVGWETVLPQTNISVLLAEDDDSTRQVVGALLRNCGYEVSSVANGMQAWEMLEDPNQHFDLVLTDVVMPCLSGVGLLTKIMSHEAGKVIPVIMMSSHDSLDIVFRCLSKGAADFLVKPVRKNELKNLWQHVWRCQSSSGSGSGARSGSGNGKVGIPKSRVGSGNNTGSNDGSDDNSSGLNVRGGSDNGSGTQAVVHPNPKQKRDVAEAEEGQATSLEKLSNQQIGQDLELATRRPAVTEADKDQNGEVQDGREARREDSPSTSGNSGYKLEKSFDAGTTNSGGSSAKAIDLIGGIAFQSKADDEGVESGEGVEESDRGASNSPINDKCVTNSNSPPTLELSLKRPRGPGEDDVDPEEKRVLRHSGGSAFSRYSTTGTTIQQMPSGNPLSLTGYPMAGAYGTHTLSPGAAGALGTGKSGHLQFPMPIDRMGSSRGRGEASTPLPPRASHKGNGQDVGSSIVGSSTPEGYSQQVKDEVASISGRGLPMPIPLPSRGMMYDGVSAAYGPAVHQVFYSHPAAPPWANGATQLSERGEVFDNPPYHDHGSYSSHHHHHHPHHHRLQPHNHPRLPQPSLHQQKDDQVVTNQGSGAPLCGSSNMAGSVPDANGGQSGGSSNGYGSNGNGNGNGSMNGSGSGSNYGSNLNTTQNGDGAGNNGGDGIVGANGVVIGHEQNRFARREAALNKFRQKRKERCFEKKVRYQSRKRLAEQRPRVRGQFVRQAVYDSNAGTEMAD